MCKKRQITHTILLSLSLALIAVPLLVVIGLALSKAFVFLMGLFSR